jgi:hypothetical protein
MHRPSLPNAPAGSGQLQALRAGAEEVAGDVDDVAEIEKRERAEGRTEESERK